MQLEINCNLWSQTYLNLCELFIWVILSTRRFLEEQKGSFKCGNVKKSFMIRLGLCSVIVIFRPSEYYVFEAYLFLWHSELFTLLFICFLPFVSFTLFVYRKHQDWTTCNLCLPTRQVYRLMFYGERAFFLSFHDQRLKPIKVQNCIFKISRNKQQQMDLCMLLSSLHFNGHNFEPFFTA